MSTQSAPRPDGPQRAARKHTGKNVVIVLALVAALVLVVTNRVLPYLADRAVYTDGEATYQLGRGEGIRYAIWDRPLRLAGEANSPGRESRPAISPDGRLLVFAVGEPGLNVELYAADLVDGVPVDPRPLSRLNSGGDDLAPAFGGGALYFASNREGGEGGFDLYAATWDGFEFGPPAPVGGGLNSSADELDPAPLGTPGLARRNGHFGWSEALAFASNRAEGGRGDHDLYLALPGGAEGRIDVLPFPGVNSPFDEREPDFTADGSALYFASDRGTGDEPTGFDLFRSVRQGGEWLPPAPLDGLNSEFDERGPAASADGFELYFSREGASFEPLDLAPELAASGEGVAELEPLPADPGELFRARSTELFRLPSAPRGWLDLLLIAALLLLALLAWLSQRWEQLDILYKCFLVSLLLHLLLLWLLREVYPEPGEYTTPGEGRQPTFQVRVLDDRTPSQALAERGGALEADWSLDRAAPPTPEREQLASVAPVRAAAAPRPEPLERAETDTRAQAPSRRSFDVARSDPVETATGPALDDREQSVERISRSAPTLAVAAPSTEVAQRAPSTEPTRAPGRLVTTATSSARELEVGPTRMSSVRRSVSPLAEPSRFEVARAQPSVLEQPAPRIDDGVEVAMPAEELASQVAAPAPEARLPEPSEVRVGRSGAGGLASLEPARVELGALEAPAPLTVEPRLAGVAADLYLRPSDVPEPTRFRPRSDVAPAPEPIDLRGPTLARLEPAETFAAPVVAGPSPSLGLGAPTALAAAPDRTRSASDGPGSRRDLAAVAPPERSLRPEVLPMETSRPPEVALPDAPDRSEKTPYRSRFGSEKKLAIETFGGGADTEAAVARGLAYLARRQSEAGNWGDAGTFHPKYRQVAVGNTALAMLAFLGAGHTHESNTEYSANVRRTIKWLLSMQDDRTGHFGNSSSYSHGISTYALAECYALTGDDQLRRPLERAVGQILRNQIPSNYRGDRRMIGGWSYYYPDGSTYDAWPRVSITSWQVMALESARLGGLIVPEHTLELAKEFIVGSWDERLGAVRYSHDPDRLTSGYPTLPGSTPAGLFVLSLLGEDVGSDRFVAPRNYLLRRMPDGFRFTNEDDFVFRAQGNVYFWYYGSLAMLRAGGAEWERWNASLKATLLPAQRDNGSWDPLDVYAEYAGDSRQDSIYTTSMCVLTLEVYYRYFTPLLQER